jgi:hypothetical protein
MQYMLLIYAEPANEPVYGTPAFDAMMAGYFALSQQLKADGVMRGGAIDRCACGTARSIPWTAPLPRPRNIWAASM